MGYFLSLVLLLVPDCLVIAGKVQFATHKSATSCLPYEMPHSSVITKAGYSLLLLRLHWRAL